MVPSLLFLNRHAATKGTVQGYRLDTAYVDACRWFHCGLIDRTQSLRIGVAYYSLDAIPELEDVGSFDEIADATGEDLLCESVNRGRKLQILWSGGIDSTTALIALAKAAFNSTLRTRIEVVCSAHSIKEYPAFFSEYIAGKFNCVVTARPICEALDDSKLIVTGEHGDQLFGSVKLEPLVKSGDASRSCRSALHRIVASEVGSTEVATSIIKFLEPQIESAPVQIRTVFDYFWWINFSLKWQHVTLRLAVFRGERFHRTYCMLRHFFRGRAFQQWALTNKKLRNIRDWGLYKESSKAYIFAYTGDQEYYLSKTKEPSLQHVLVDREQRRGRRLRVSWCLGRKPTFVFFKPKRLDRWSTAIKESTNGE